MVHTNLFLGKQDRSTDVGQSIRTEAVLDTQLECHHHVYPVFLNIMAKVSSGVRSSDLRRPESDLFRSIP